MEPMDAIVRAEDIEALDSADPRFSAWVRRCYLTGDLEPVAQAVIRAGKAGDAKEALRYLAQFAASQPPAQFKIGRADFGQRSPHHRLRELARLLSAPDTSSSADVFRMHGLIGHAAVPRLLAGELVTKAPRGSRPHRLSRQRGFSWENPIEEMQAAESFPRKLSPQEFRQLFDRVHRNWRILQAELEKGNGGSYSILERRRGTVRRLYQALAEVYGAYPRQLRRREIFEDEHLLFLALMSWASAAVRHRAAGERLLFREIPIFAAHYDLGGGRIDALEVILVDGRPPGRRDRALLQTLAQHRYRSCGHLISSLVSTFAPRRLSLAIKEWKFSVGDGIGAVIQPANVESSPLPEHTEQLQLYLALAVLSWNIVRRAREEELWQTDAFDLWGEMVYFFPQSLPIAHVVRLEPSEREQVFIGSIAAHWRTASDRAAMRELTNAVLRHAIELLGNGEKKKPPSRETGTQPPLFEIVKSGHVVPVVERYRRRAQKFADEFGVMEVIKGRGRTWYELHVDRLLEAIERGDVLAGRTFNDVRGGHVSCLVHSERTPSLHVWFERGGFHCFGCGITGGFAPGSVPPDIHVEIKPRSAWRKEQRATEKVIIPEELRRIMAAAERSLHGALSGSAGERYLKDVRGLDPAIAHSLGVGFGTLGLIDDLLDAGFAYDDLFRFGFLSLSPRITPSGRVVQRLLWRGFRLQDVPRPLTVREKGVGRKEIPAYPFAVLERRVTFPLFLGGVLNSFYGRSIDPECPSELKHRKLKTGTPHGGFNTASLQAGTGLVIVIEGGMDALTMIEAGNYPKTLALIGVKNFEIIEEVARYGGDVALALDCDKSGRESTRQVAELLSKRGFKGEIFDWTGRFIESPPHGLALAGMKDVNEWWLTYRRRFDAAAVIA